MMSMYNYCDDAVHFQRRKCSTSPAVGVQLERYIHEYLVNRAAVLQELCQVLIDNEAKIETYLQASSDFENVMEKLYRLDNP